MRALRRYSVASRFIPGDPGGAKTQRAAGPEESIDVHAAVDGDKGDKEKGHLPKLTPMPSAIFTSSPSGSTSLSLLIASSIGTEVMLGG